jgi:lipocalin
MKDIKTRILTIIFNIVIITSCISVDPAKRYQSKFAEPAEYPAWLKRHSKFMGGLFNNNKDWRIIVAENQNKAHKIKVKAAEKEAEILKKVELIKSQIK